MTDRARRLYCMIVNGKKEMMSKREAVRAYDNGFVRVSFGDIILEPDGKTRPFSDEDQREISAATFELDK